MSEKLKQDISIGPNLKALSHKSGLSQEQVAARLQTMELNVSREMLSQMEQGRYSIRVSVLLGLNSIYHASYDDFFAGLSLKRS